MKTSFSFLDSTKQNKIPYDALLQRSETKKQIWPERRVDHFLNESVILVEWTCLILSPWTINFSVASINNVGAMLVPLILSFTGSGTGA
jgi:hypothetical protein